MYEECTIRFSALKYEHSGTPASYLQCRKITNAWGPYMQMPLRWVCSELASSQSCARTPAQVHNDQSSVIVLAAKDHKKRQASLSHMPGSF